MEDEWKRKIQKPIGVYVCTVIILIKFGVLNFIGYFLGIRNAGGEVALPIVVISFSLCLFTAATAIWAFLGHNEGRIALLILLPLNIIWILLFNVSALLNNEKADDEVAVLSIIQQIMLSLLVIGIEWYFMSKKVVQYYKQND